MISVLYEEGFQEVIIERGVVVSYEKELVFFIKLVHVFGQHVHEFNVHPVSYTHLLLETYRICLNM